LASSKEIVHRDLHDSGPPFVLVIAPVDDLNDLDSRFSKDKDSSIAVARRKTQLY
jgi:hypothetical protein